MNKSKWHDNKIFLRAKGPYVGNNNAYAVLEQEQNLNHKNLRRVILFYDIINIKQNITVTTQINCQLENSLIMFNAISFCPATYKRKFCRAKFLLEIRLTNREAFEINKLFNVTYKLFKVIRFKMFQKQDIWNYFIIIKFLQIMKCTNNYTWKKLMESRI